MAKDSMKNRDAHGDRKVSLRNDDERAQRAQGRSDRNQQGTGRENVGRSGSRSNAGSSGNRSRGRKSNDR